MSSLSVNEMKKQLLTMYPNGTKWRLKVLNMSDSQVLAIYKKYQKNLEDKKNANNQR